MDEIEQLKKRMTDLESRFDRLLSDSQRMVRLIGDCQDLLDKRCLVSERELVDAFQRIANIELDYFPKLAGDLVQLHTIIGEGDDKAYNPLDFREDDASPSGK